MESIRHGITENTFGGSASTACIMAFMLGKMKAAHLLLENTLALVDQYDVPRSATLLPAAHASVDLSSLSETVEAYRRMTRVAAEESNKACQDMGMLHPLYLEALRGVYLPRVVRSASESIIQHPVAFRSRKPTAARPRSRRRPACARTSSSWMWRCKG